MDTLESKLWMKLVLSVRQVCAILGGLEGLAKRVQSKRRTALLPAVKNTPHPEKVAKGGEDAWMVSVDEQGGALAVADGASLPRNNSSGAGTGSPRRDLGRERFWWNIKQPSMDPH